MFYFLTNNLSGIFNVFRYISFRTGGALLTSLFIYLFFGNKFINFVKTKFVQPIRKEGPESHLKKQGTPTMGGLLMVLAVFISTILWTDVTNGYVWIILFTMVSFATIGFIDDYLKKIKKNKDGLSGKFKVIGQVGLGLVVGAVMFYHSDILVKRKDSGAGSSDRNEIEKRFLPTEK